MGKGDPKGGRPHSLEPDEVTLKTVKGLGTIQATSKECAAVLGVTEPTWLTFKKSHQEVEDAFRIGQGEGLASLRRRQFKAADAGNATMLIWLGKQYLDQSDKQDINSRVAVDVTVTDARSKLEHIVTRQLTAAPNQGSAGKPN